MIADAVKNNNNKQSFFTPDYYSPKIALIWTHDSSPKSLRLNPTPHALLEITYNFLKTNQLA